MILFCLSFRIYYFFHLYKTCSHFNSQASELLQDNAALWGSLSLSVVANSVLPTQPTPSLLHSLRIGLTRLLDKYKQGTQDVFVGQGVLSITCECKLDKPVSVLARWMNCFYICFCKHSKSHNWVCGLQGLKIRYSNYMVSEYLKYRLRCFTAPCRALAVEGWWLSTHSPLKGATLLSFLIWGGLFNNLHSCVGNEQ